MTLMWIRVETGRMARNVNGRVKPLKYGIIARGTNIRKFRLLSLSLAYIEMQGISCTKNCFAIFTY